MDFQQGISATSRTLLFLAAAGQAVSGVTLYAVPSATADASRFISMTLGACCLGCAAMVWQITQQRRWNLIQPAAFFLAVYIIGALAVLMAHGSPVYWWLRINRWFVFALYLTFIALFGLFIDLVMQRPGTVSEGRLTTRRVRLCMRSFALSTATVAFALWTGWIDFLHDANVAASASDTAFKTQTVFYLALTLSAAYASRARRMAALTAYVWGVLALGLPLLAAALLHLPLFYASGATGLLYPAFWGLTVLAASGHVWSQRHVPTDAAIQTRRWPR